MAIDHTTEVPHSSAGRNARTVVVCPDSFKGSLNSDDVAHAIAAGWRQVCPEDTLILSPMADGGEGTRRAFNTARPEAKVVELAELCGIELYEESWTLGMPALPRSGRYCAKRFSPPIRRSRQVWREESAISMNRMRPRMLNRS